MSKAIISPVVKGSHYSKNKKDKQLLFMQNTRTLTIKDIAAYCGVSKSTVSRVLNQDPNVKPATREKIEQVMFELDFHPNRTARAMRNQQDKVVGIIVTRLHSTAESQTLSAILTQLYAQQVTPLIVESQFEPQKVKQELAVFQSRQVDGVIVFGFSELEIDILKSWKKPIVTVARAYSNISAVYYDDEKAIEALMEQFYQQGHRKIAYLGVQESDETTGKHRMQAYLDYCAAHHLVPHFALSELNLESGYQQMAILAAQPFSALVCASSSLAAGAFKYLQKIGKNSPLACVGTNTLLQAFVPQLISLDFGYKQAGEIAVKLLMMQFSGEKQVVQQKIPFKLS